MKTLTIDITDFSEHLKAAEHLISFAENEKVFLLDAPMGAGKTTFIKSLCQYLGVMDVMSSPTYSIVNEYHTKNNSKIFHFDLYRLQRPEELMDIGFEEYIDSGCYCFIEWPELGMTFISKFVKVSIEQKGNKRYLCAEKN